MQAGDKKESVTEQDTENNNKILHNNWIINNQILKESNSKCQKLPGSKSVIIVKPNHHALSQHLQDSQMQSQTQSRSSLKKGSGSEKKMEKEEGQTANSKRVLI